MNSRLTSLIATVVINGGMAYALFVGLAMTMQKKANEKMTVVNVATELPPPPKILIPDNYRPDTIPWATAGVAGRNLAFVSIQKWINENTVSDDDRRLAKWRTAVPQGSGPGRVTRLRPSNLTTHTLYWPAAWSNGPLPIIAWGNGYGGMCNNSSLPYAAFLSELASYGYFVVAVGNDDIDYPQPEGLEILPDGRPVRTDASALKKAVDWAIAENSRAGSPYQGKIDTSKIAYMGHGCGGQQAMSISSDPRTTTTVVLNAAAKFYPGASEDRKGSIAHFEGAKDDGAVLEVGDANFARAQSVGRPMYKAALNGMGHDGAYPGPDRRWSKAVLAWLNWQLKGDSAAATVVDGLGRNGWSLVDATGLDVLVASSSKASGAKAVLTAPAAQAIVITPPSPALQSFYQVPTNQVQVVPEGKLYVLRNLVDDNLLYTLDKDEPGKSNCTDACAAEWPALPAPEGAQPVGKWTIVKRDDGASQWAFEGKPVYSFSRPPEPVATRKGMGGWHTMTFPAP